MENIQKTYYIEVGQVLDILGDTYKQKVPEQYRKLFYINQNDYKMNTRKQTKIEDLTISRNALIILSILNLKYWEKDIEKKKKIIQIYEKNEKEYQEKINVYKQDNWLKNRKSSPEEIIETKTEETSLITQKDISIFKKIKIFFINLINKRKQEKGTNKTNK